MKNGIEIFKRVILLKEGLYTLIATANKRIPVYENNVFVDTKPYTLKKRCNNRRRIIIWTYKK